MGEAILATQYPEDNRHEYDDLLAKLRQLEEENSRLNIALMRKSAGFSDADETLRRWKTELEIVASKSGHNGCHIWIPELLKRTLGHTGNFLDPEKMTAEQFAEGCVVYHSDRFGNCGIRLRVIKIPEELKDKGILTEEQARRAGEALGFKGETDV